MILCGRHHLEEFIRAHRAASTQSCADAGHAQSPRGLVELDRLTEAVEAWIVFIEGQRWRLLEELIEAAPGALIRPPHVTFRLAAIYRIHARVMLRRDGSEGTVDVIWVGPKP